MGHRHLSDVTTVTGTRWQPSALQWGGSYAEIRAREAGGTAMNGRWSAWARFVMWALGLGLATLVLTISPSGVSADSGGGGGGGGGGGAGGKPEVPADPDYAAGMKAVDGKQYAAAIP